VTLRDGVRVIREHVPKRGLGRTTQRCLLHDGELRQKARRDKSDEAGCVRPVVRWAKEGDSSW
jgi:hypothetical protein